MIVLGASPAGLWAALRAHAAAPSLPITIYDSRENPFEGWDQRSPVLALNAYEADAFTSQLLHGAQEFQGPFYQFLAGELAEWFAARGVPLRESSDERLCWPDDAPPLAEVLRQALDDAGIALKTGVRVEHCDPGREGHRFWLTLREQGVIECKHLVIAPGEMLSSEARRWASDLSLPWEDLQPARFGWQTLDERLRGLHGVQVPRVGITLPGFDLATVGALDFTPWGISGPAVLEASARAAHGLQKVRYRFIAEIDWLCPDSGPPPRLEDWQRQHPQRRLAAKPLGDLPPKLWCRLWQGLDIDAEHTTWGDLRKPQLAAATRLLRHCEVEVTRKRLDYTEIATCGGLPLNALDCRQMVARQTPGLYWVGHSLACEPLPGGAAMHLEWLTGALAAQAIAEVP